MKHFLKYIVFILTLFISISVFAAYSVYCDTAVATKWWIIGTGTGGVNRLSQVMADNPSGVEEADNPGNYQPWSTFMTEVVADGVYLIHLNLEIGDGSTSTELESRNGEYVKFDPDDFPLVKDNAELTLGVYDSDDNYGYEGATWYIEKTAGSSTVDLIDNSGSNGIINIYGSTLFIKGNGTSISANFRKGTLTGHDSFFVGLGENAGARRTSLYIRSTVSAYLTRCAIQKMQTCNFSRVLTADNCTFENINYVELYGNIGGELSTPTFIDVTSLASYTAGIVSVINPNTVPATKKIDDAAGEIDLKYTFNLHITDKDGNDIQSAVVDLYSISQSTYAWTQGSVSTAADGTITEQQVLVKKWMGTSEAETDYNQFTLTISKVGYKTYISAPFTINAPVTDLPPIKLEAIPIPPRPVIIGEAADDYYFAKAVNQ